MALPDGDDFVALPGFAASVADMSYKRRRRGPDERIGGQFPVLVCIAGPARGHSECGVGICQLGLPAPRACLKYLCLAEWFV